jgi:hypothetical protein
MVAGNHSAIIVEAAGPGAANDLHKLFGRVLAVAMRYASQAVPLYDPARGPWYGRTQCVWDAGFVACTLARNWPVPEDLTEVWNWYEAGH